MRDTASAVGRLAPILVGVAAGLACVAATTAMQPALAGAAVSDQIPLERVAAQVEPSVVFLQTTWTFSVYDKRNKLWLHHHKPLSLSVGCTGFYVNPNGYIASAGHCVSWDDFKADALKLTAKTAKADHYYSNAPPTVAGILKYNAVDYQFRNLKRQALVANAAAMAGFTAGRFIPARVIGEQPEANGDESLLKVERRHTPALLLAPDSTVRVGQRVVAIGYPQDVSRTTDPTLDPSFKDGTVSSLRTVGHGKFPVLEISAALGHGQSGGPAVNEDGEVIGINSFIASDTSQAFNFVRPPGPLRQLLRRAHVSNSIDSVQKDYRAGIASYYAGKRNDSIKHFNAVLAVVPTDAFARRYGKLAEKLPNEGVSAWRIALDVLVFVGALAAAALGYRRRRTRRRQQPPAAASPAKAGELVASVAAVDRAAAAPARGAPGRSGDAGSVVLVVEATGERHPVVSRIVIGREHDVDITLADEQASRRHASIAPSAGGGVELSDLGSSNGTFVNGRRIGAQAIALRAGDIVIVGQTSLRIESTGGDAARTTVRPA